MRVLCCGTFDHLHPGHLSFIEQAAALGDELFVVIARDENVMRIKGHYPDHSEQERKAILEQLEAVDDVRLGYPGHNFLQVVADIAPGIIALGYDQRRPPNLAKAFPDCEIVVLEAHHPDKYKSSLFRRGERGA
jgi:FAD synthetase